MCCLVVAVAVACSEVATELATECHKHGYVNSLGIVHDGANNLLDVMDVLKR